MSLVKVEGVSNEVFIPDQLKEEDKSFLVERTENIVSIVTRAKVEIGLELLKVEQRFRESKEFGGPKGWYHKWLASIHIAEKMRKQAVNAATLLTRTDADSVTVESLPYDVLSRLGTPNITSAIKAFTGASDSLATFIVDSKGGAVNVASVGAATDSAANQLLTGEQFIRAKEEELDAAKQHVALIKESGLSSKSDEYNRAFATKSSLEKTLETANRRLESLAAEKAELEAKYGGDNWRNEENIRKEFSAAIAKAREEEQAKKQATKAVDTTEADKLRQQYEDLLKANAELRAQITDKEQRLEQTLEMSRKAHKQLEHAKGATREWENYSTARRRSLLKTYISNFWEGSAMLGYCRKYPEESGDVMRDGFTASVEQLEDLAIDAMIAWLPFIPAEKLEPLLDALAARGTDAPAETIDSRELTTIDV